MLIERAANINWADFEGIRTLGVTAGASAPDALVNEILDAFAERFELRVRSNGAERESITFNLPRELRAPARNASAPQ